jgi:hypothetical protein
MHRLAPVVVLAVGGVLAAPASAVAVPSLSFGEATRQIGKSLLKSDKVDATPGTLEASCWRLARNRVRCSIEFGDDYGDWYCGQGTVRETQRWYYTSLRWHPCSA